MSEFRLTQISDTHLGRRFPGLIANFHRVCEHIDADRPDLVINTGDVSFDGPTSRDDVVFAKSLHDALPVACRYLPGNHDIGDNPTAIGPAPKPPVSEAHRQQFRDIIGEDHWSFEAAGWRFIGLNSLVMNSGLAFEAAQFDWLASEISRSNGGPVALFLHKPLFLDQPDDPELPRPRSATCRNRHGRG
jgi:3',5'-cyclic AMP phosphodiesterase CpdA